TRDRWYLNCAVEIETDLPPRRLLRLTQGIEAQAGRVREAAPFGAYVARTRDSDILLYEDRVSADHARPIPHPVRPPRRCAPTPAERPRSTSTRSTASPSGSPSDPRTPTISSRRPISAPSASPTASSRERISGRGCFRF